MKRMILMIALLCILLLVVVFALGPKTSIELDIKEINLPEDLESYLDESESQFSDIIPETEKTIIWADTSRKEKTALSIVYFHGFSATRQEVSPLCDNLADSLGANLYYTRLTGHGRGEHAMGEMSVNDWANDAVEALEIGRRIGERVIIIGTSTGGTLAAWLATQYHDDDIAAFVLISPNFGPKDGSSEALNWPWAYIYTPVVLGETYTWEPLNEQQEKFWNTRYPSSALLPMMGLVRLARESDLESIRQPMLFLFSMEDQVVEAEKTKAIFPRIGSVRKEIAHFSGSDDGKDHVIAGDIVSPGTTEVVGDMILKFLNNL